MPPVVRVPSPQELSQLAQSILQSALIKKQLEEQKERFARRQQERCVCVCVSVLILFLECLDGSIIKINIAFAFLMTPSIC